MLKGEITPTYRTRLNTRVHYLSQPPLPRENHIDKSSAQWSEQIFREIQNGTDTRSNCYGIGDAWHRFNKSPIGRKVKCANIPQGKTAVVL